MAVQILCFQFKEASDASEDKDVVVSLFVVLAFICKVFTIFRYILQHIEVDHNLQTEWY